MRKYEFDIQDLRNALDRHSIVAMTDPEGHITMVNDNFCKISKYSREELIGQDHRILNSGFHSKDFMKNLWTTINQGNVWQDKIGNRAKDDEIYWVNSTIMPTFDNQNRLKSFLVINTDITDQINAEIDHEFILKSLGIGVWKRSFITNALQWDESMYRLHGVNRLESKSAEEVWENSLDAQTKENILSETRRAIQEKRDFDTSYQITRPDGRIQDIGSKAFFISDKDGKATSMHGININRTKEAELEREIAHEQAKSLQAARLASLGEISAGVAHEINNPLANILGAVTTMEKFKDNPEKFNSKVQMVHKSIHRIQKIVDGLKKFAHNSEGTEFKFHSLTKIVNECILLIEPRSKHQGVPVSCHIDCEHEIYCDELAIEQVIINLLNNAIDAVKDNGDKWVKAEVTADNNIPIFRVIDSGHGIPEPVQKRLFEPFFTTKPVGSGTGLGLSIAKGILESHGASISLVDNPPNTCFEIRFKK